MDKTTEEDGDQHVGVFKASSFSVKLSYLTATLGTHCWMGSSSDADMIQGKKAYLSLFGLPAPGNAAFSNIITCAQVLLCPGGFCNSIVEALCFRCRGVISFDAELVSMSGFGSHFVFASFEFLMRVRKYVRLVPGVFFLRVFEAVWVIVCPF